MLREVKLGLAGIIMAGATYCGFSAYNGMRAAESRIALSPEYARVSQLEHAIRKLEDASILLETGESVGARTALSQALFALGDQGTIDDSLRGAYAALGDNSLALAPREAIREALRQLPGAIEHQRSQLPLGPRLAKGVCAAGLGLAILAGLVALGYGSLQFRKER
jgi:hypothetical protein